MFLSVNNNVIIYTCNKISTNKLELHLFAFTEDIIKQTSMFIHDRTNNY